VQVGEVRAKKGRPTVVEINLICETESQKRILVGRGGEMVKAIGTAARPAVEAVLGAPAYLEIRVRVRRNWRRDSAELDRLGV
jgi:GTPase